MKPSNLNLNLIKVFFCTLILFVSGMVQAYETGECYIKATPHVADPNYANYYKVEWRGKPGPGNLEISAKLANYDPIARTGTVAMVMAPLDDKSIKFNTEIKLPKDKSTYGLSWVQSKNYQAGKSGWSISTNGKFWHIQLEDKKNGIVYNEKVQCKVIYYPDPNDLATKYTIGEINDCYQGRFNDISILGYIDPVANTMAFCPIL